jgi:RHS repeat-associated protein
VRRHIACALVLLPLFATVVAAQNFPSVDTHPVRGFMPNADQVASPIDNIDPVSGKLHVQIPLGSLPARAGFGFDVNLEYDAHEYYLIPTVEYHTPNPVPPFTEDRYLEYLSLGPAGWKYNFKNYKLMLEEQAGVCLPDTHPNYNPLAIRHWRLRIALADGSEHILHPKGFEGTTGFAYSGDGFAEIMPTGMKMHCDYSLVYTATGLLTYYASDASYLKVELNAPGSGSSWDTLTWRLYVPDGRRIVRNGTDAFPEPYDSLYLFDPNNNRVRILNGCYDPGTCNRPYTQILDDLDRVVQIDMNSTNASSTATKKSDTITAPGPGNQVWTVNWKLLHIGGDGRKYQYTLSPPYDPLYQNIAFNFYKWVVEYVQLPLLPAVQDQPPPVSNSYAFGYSDNSFQDKGYGELDYIRTPTGAQYAYNYQLEGVAIAYADTIAHDNPLKDRKITHDGVTDLTTSYTFGVTASTFKNDIGGNTSPWQTVYTFNWKNNPSQWDSGLVTRIDEPNGTVRKRTFAQNKAYGLRDSAVIATPNNPFVQRETITVGNAAGVPTKTAVTDVMIDKNGNVLSRTEYDWVDYAGTAVENPPPTNKLRENTITYWASVPAATDSTTNDPNAYWREHNLSNLPSTTSPRRLDTIKRQTVSNGTTTQAVTEYAYSGGGEYTTGNVTTEYHWDSVKAPSAPSSLSSSNAQVLTRTYDAYGNVTNITGPGNIQTHITYAAQGNISAGTVVTRVDAAYGTPEQRSVQYTWNTNGTAVAEKKDLDNNITTTFTYDVVGRQLTAIEGGFRKVETIYKDDLLTVTTKRDLFSLGDGKLQTRETYDQLGRVKLMQTSDGPPLQSPPSTDAIKVSTTYTETSNGTRVITSTPYRTTSDPTLQWQCLQHDRLGRVTSVAMFSGSTPPATCTTGTPTGTSTTAYDANITKVADPAQKVRWLQRDALGRLLQVTEDPGGVNTNFVTTYAYDALDNLRQVNQGGQTRTFNYTSLSRLTSARYPETTTVDCGGGLLASTCYTYTDAGDLATRKDARSIETSFTYDPLHRLKQKTYVPASAAPQVDLTYYLGGIGAIPGAVGQLKSVASSAAATMYTYDAQGRLKTSSNDITGCCTSMQFTYDWHLNDALKSLQYPSGRTVNYDVDDAGRTKKVYGGTTTYADMTVITDPYTPDGRLAKVRLGNGLYDTRDYQTPGPTTPMRYKLGTTLGGTERLQLAYTFSGTQNNGNVLTHTITNGSTWAQAFTYDTLNRLTCAAEAVSTPPSQPCTATTWQQTYDHDQYGNHWVSTSTGIPFDTHEPTASGHIDHNTNRLNMTDVAYDEVGNQTKYTPYNQITYDAENRMTSMTTTPTPGYGSMTIAYDGEGHRVKKTWTPSTGTATTTYYVYDAMGTLAAEYSTTPNTSPAVVYPFTDMLGSIRALSNGTGTLQECYDYLPYGRMLGRATNTRPNCYPDLGTLPTSAIPQKFTGKERDLELAYPLDNFVARYYSGPQGTFTSPDPLFFQKEMLNDPQRFNLYGYARNNPLHFVDPTGQRIELTGETDEERQRQLAAIQATVGKEAGGRLKIELDKASGKYFVGIVGDVTTFRDINPVASTFATIITLDEAVKFSLLGSKDRLEMGDGKEYTLYRLKAGGATARDANGQLRVFVQNSDEGYPHDFFKSHHWWTILSNNEATVTGHEFGHALEHMFYNLLGQKPSKEVSNAGALSLENKVRRLQGGPNAPLIRIE